MRKEEKEKGSQKSKGEEGSNPKIDYSLIGSVCSLTLSIWSFPQRKIKPREGKNKSSTERLTQTQTKSHAFLRQRGPRWILVRLPFISIL